MAWKAPKDIVRIRGDGSAIQDGCHSVGPSLQSHIREWLGETKVGDHPYLPAERGQRSALEKK